MEVAQLRAEIAAIADKQENRPIGTPGGYGEELDKLQKQIDANTVEIKNNTERHTKLRDSIQGVMKKVREEFDALKAETLGQLSLIQGNSVVPNKSPS